jgi:hypothetical protein
MVLKRQVEVFHMKLLGAGSVMEERAQIQS